MAKPTRDEVIDWAKKQNLDVDNFIDGLDQYKTAHDKLTAGLKEAVAESIKYKRERDSLIKDVEKLREELEGYKKINYELELAVDSDLKQQVDKWFNEWQDVKVENDLLELELKDSKHNYRVMSDKYN